MAQRSSFIFQRLPFLSHLCIAWIAIFGPGVCPVLHSTFFFLVHLILLTTNLQSAWGTYCAWRGVERCSETDWYSYWKKESKKQERNRSPQPLESGDATIDYNQVEHVIILPVYKEDPHTLHETLKVLASHARAKTNYRLCLGMEEREPDAQKIAQNLIDEYLGNFLQLTNSLHPNGLEGEVAGKSSNVNWAVRQMASRFPSDQQRATQIITVVDSDTALAQDYFDCVSALYCLARNEDRRRMMFVVPIIFDRNASDVPIVVKVTDIMWSIAGLSSIYPSSGCKIPTSAYGISMLLAASVGFWDAGPEAIGEDMHMTIKCFLCTGGKLKVESVYSPASQMDVIGTHHGRGLKGYWSDLEARYRQAIRHMWGSLDFGYATRRIICGDVGKTYGESCDVDNHAGLVRIEMSMIVAGTKKTVPSRSALHSRSLRYFLSVLIWLASRLYSPIRPCNMRSNLSKLTRCRKALINVLNFRVLGPMHLMLRLFQAHLMLGWLFILLTTMQFVPVASKVWIWFVSCFSGAEYCFFWSPSAIRPGDNILRTNLEVLLPSSYTWTILCLYFADLIRTLSVPLMLLTFFFHTKFHQAATVSRWNNAGCEKLGMRPSSRATRPLPWAMFEILALPGAVIFGIIPLLHAQCLHLFTRELAYTVSLKSRVFRGDSSNAVA